MSRDALTDAEIVRIARESQVPVALGERYAGITAIGALLRFARRLHELGAIEGRRWAAAQCRTAAYCNPAAAAAAAECATAIDQWPGATPKQGR